MPTDHADISAPAAAGRFARVPARWLEDPGVGVDELAVLTALAVHAGPDGVCVVRQRTLAGLLRRSREWVCRVLARLCGPGGLVEKEYRADRDGWNLACRYRLRDLGGSDDGAADVSGEPSPGPSTGGAQGAARDGGQDAAVGDDPPPPGPPPAEPAAPEATGPVPPAAAAVIAPAPAGVTDGAHREQTLLNKDSSSDANLRCVGCHCREQTPGRVAVPNGGCGRNCPVPADWQPGGGDLIWLAAHRPDLDARYMTEVFVCGSRARGLRYADPSAAWRRWALAERAPGRRPVASAVPPRETQAPPPRPAPRGYYAEQRERNAALGREVLASMMARRGDAVDGWMEG